jgi:hypothetical protein
VKAPKFSFQFPSNSNFHIRKTHVRSVARYIDLPRRNTYLDVAMVRDTMQKRVAELSASGMDYIETTPSTNRWDNGGLMNIWYEASITTRRLENVFSENRDLEFGEVAHWRGEALKRDRVFYQLLIPAVTMITGMDEIGQHNDNKMCPKHLKDEMEVEPGSESHPHFW